MTTWSCFVSSYGVVTNRQVALKMGMAFVSTLAPDESFTTMGLSITFFRPVWQTTLRAQAHVVNRGKNVGYVECDVTDQDGKRVARASSTCMVLRGEPAKWR
jgi:uncharacterized protein (TIGR00369 family)